MIFYFKLEFWVYLKAIYKDPVNSKRSKIRENFFKK